MRLLDLLEDNLSFRKPDPRLSTRLAGFWVSSKLDLLAIDPGVGDVSRRLIAQEPRETPAGIADRFLFDSVYPTPDGSVAVDDLRDVYLDWCARRPRQPLRDEEIAGAINDIFRRVGLPVIDVDGTRMVIGVGLKEQGAAA